MNKLEGIKESLDTIGKFLNYLMHPGQIWMAFWHWTVSVSFWICLFIALFSLFSYILGVKKFAKYIPWSIGIYALIQAIGSAI